MARAVPTPPEGEKPVEEMSVPQLVREILGDSTDLIRQEFQLLREEMAITFRDTGIATSKVAAGAIVAILAVGFLGFSLIVLLSNYIAAWISALIVGLAFLAVAGYLIYSARNDFQRMKVAPNTMETLKEDAEWLRHPTRPDGR